MKIKLLVVSLFLGSCFLFADESLEHVPGENIFEQTHYLYEHGKANTSTIKLFDPKDIVAGKGTKPESPDTEIDTYIISLDTTKNRKPVRIAAAFEISDPITAENKHEYIKMGQESLRKTGNTPLTLDKAQSALISTTPISVESPATTAKWRVTYFDHKKFLVVEGVSMFGYSLGRSYFVIPKKPSLPSPISAESQGLDLSIEQWLLR